MKVIFKPLGISIFLASVLFLIATTACVKSVLEGTPVAANPTTRPTLEKASWEEKWNKTLSAARGEGSVRIYTSTQPEVRSKMAKAFKDKYGIDLEYVTGRPPELTQKVMSERRAGLYLADAFFGGGTLHVTLLKPNGLLDTLQTSLILPEVTDPKAWSQGEIPYYDMDHTAVAFLAALTGFIVINTDMVKPSQITSYRDLLKPEWKGKMVLQDPNMGGTALWWITLLSNNIWGPQETRAFLTELKKTDVPVINDNRLQAEWVARAKYPIAVAPSSDVVFEMVRAGAPLAFVKAKEGAMITPGTGAVSLANKAAHPNASAVFVNWLLSKDGQSVVSQAVGRPSLRVDVDREGFDPNLLPDPGEKPYVEDEKFILATPEVLATFNEIFK